MMKLFWKNVRGRVAHNVEFAGLEYCIAVLASCCRGFFIRADRFRSHAAHEFRNRDDRNQAVALSNA